MKVKVLSVSPEGSRLVIRSGLYDITFRRAADGKAKEIGFTFWGGTRIGSFYIPSEFFKPALKVANGIFFDRLRRTERNRGQLLFPFYEQKHDSNQKELVLLFLN